MPTLSTTRRGRRDRRPRGGRRLLSHTTRPAGSRPTRTERRPPAHLPSPGARRPTWPRHAPTSRPRSCRTAASSWSAGGARAGRWPLPRSSIRPRGRGRAQGPCRGAATSRRRPSSPAARCSSSAAPISSMVGGTAVDLYDPATNSWGTTGETTEPRGQHVAAAACGWQGPRRGRQRRPWSRMSGLRRSTIPPREPGPPPRT